MSFLIDIQNELNHLPFELTDIEAWVISALSEKTSNAELTLRFVSEQEMFALNSQYRKKNSSTNVLSFPSDIPEEIAKQLEAPFIGDIIICPDVLFTESQEQDKDLKFHWAHIVIHGVLHLLGYDHIDEKDAIDMQFLEIKILKKLNYPNPYEYDNE
jgi:probable rRNA maturation factor